MKEQYKILHLFPYNLFTKPFLEFIKTVYSKEEHGFIVYGEALSEASAIESVDNVCVIPKLTDMLRNKELINLGKKAEKVIFHTNNLGVTRLLLRFPIWLKKAYIIFWGFDIYCYRNKPEGFKDYLWKKLQKIQIRRVHGIGILTENEEQILDKLVGKIKGKIFHVMYPQTMNYEKLFDLRKVRRSENPVKIMLGNNASPTNRHFEILEKMRKYAAEDIMVYCPLSYGSKENAIKVIERGKEIFGEHFVPIMDLLPVEEYWEMLSACKIGIYNNDRQQAMGNISIMLSQGAKVYIRKDTSMWERYRQKGYELFDISQIGELEWQDIVQMSEESKNNNMRVYDSLVSTERKKKIWDYVFLDKKEEEE